MSFPTPPTPPSLPDPSAPLPAVQAAPPVPPTWDSAEGIRLRRSARQAGVRRPEPPRPPAHPSVKWGAPPKIKTRTSPHIPPGHMSGPEVQARLGVSQSYVSELGTTGRINGEKIGGRWYFDPESVERYAEARQQN